MSARMQTALLTTAVILLVASIAFGQRTSESECRPTAQMQVYSNAFLSKETGDVGGYELAVKQQDDSTVNVLLFVYEGVPNNDGISISGHLRGKKLTVEGNWIEHLTEFPSKNNCGNALPQNKWDPQFSFVPRRDKYWGYVARHSTVEEGS